MEFLKIYLELDAILDTRLGLLNSIDPELAVKAFHDDRYYHRLSNDFSWMGLSKADFNKAWAERTADILPDSTITPIPGVLAEVVHSLELEHLRNPTARKPLVEVNVWPYQIDEKERIMLINAILRRTGLDTTVNVVYFDPQKELTMKRLRHEYAMLFIYNFTQWTLAHLKEMQETIAPRTTIMAPTLYEEREPTPEDMVEHGLPENTDPAGLIQRAFAEFVALDCMPNFFFCIFRPERIEQWKAMYYTNVPAPAYMNPLAKEEDLLQHAIGEALKRA